MGCFALLVLFVSYAEIASHWNLYQTDGIDCFEYHVNEQHFRGAHFKFPTYQKIKYCHRPTESLDNDSNGQRISFSQLREMNVTIDQLIAWSTPVDQVEKYSLYTSSEYRPLENALDSEWLMNCTSPWFGRQCEYSFALGPNVSLADVVQITFREKTTNRSHYSLTNLTCLQSFQCDRGAPMCLDWREVCNGRIDCRDGEDEEHCWQLEMNECGPGEYRCHNGLCVSADFLHDDRNNPDCLDRTDELSGWNSFYSCYQDPTFRCEEHTCHPSFREFSCGDGHCETPLHTCKSRRDELLKDSILERGGLVQPCWYVMVCLTQLKNSVDGASCRDLFTSESPPQSYLRQCPSVFQFPVRSMIFDHVRLFYFNNRTDLDVNNVLLPNLICYDRSLYDTIRPTVMLGNLTCRRSSEMLRGSTTNYVTLVTNITSYFRGCSFTNRQFEVLPPSMYRCNGSSKWISKHRLMDNLRDCPWNDDERYEHSCALNDSFRFQCNRRDKQCFAPIHYSTICKNRSKDNYTQILFHQFCDGISHLLVQETAGFNHTDENDCEQWPCSNMYTRCDDVVNCPNAIDEWNCISADCPIGFRPCISPINYTMTCLAYKYVQDGKIDCLGASDEFQLCQTNPVDAPSLYRYRCWNTSRPQCTGGSNVCNGVGQCTFGDDENEKMCEKIKNPCPKTPAGNRSTNNETLCQLFDREVEQRSFFMLENITGIRLKAEGKLPVSNALEKPYRPNDPFWSWRCNRGLYARYRLSTLQESYRCFCPPSYYGDSCEFQSERISLTLGILVADQYHSYTIGVRLMDETNTTISHEQFPFMGIWGCYRSINTYFLYPTRPKNLSNSYYLQIDAYDRSAMTYLASWHLDIPFPFLPVNRIASQLMVPGQAASAVHSCPLKCRNGGQCRRYVNSPRLFCHCPTNWFGALCEQPVNCSDCSSSSLCVGSVAQRPICLCPVDRAGPRCSIPVSCQPGSCMNNGRCVLIDDQISNNNFICICLEPFYGTRCEYAKSEFLVSLDKDDEFVSYVLAHVVTTSNESQPATEVMIKKAIPDQSSVTFYLKEPFHLVFIQLNQRYYLGTHPHTRCSFIDELIDENERAMPQIRLIKNYPVLCSRHANLSCFFDGYYMCLCTSERHANCFEFNHRFDLSCRHNDYCENDGSCYQDHRVCPSATICVCADCYFGARCQYYAEILGVTLDDILRYEFRRQLPFSQQKVVVILTAVITGLMFVIGSISSIASFVTFRGKKVQQVGCGMYLLAASVTSFLTVLVIILKFWFLVCSQLNLIQIPTMLHLGCTVIEPVLKVLFYTDNWFKACVAIERSITVFRGVYFNRSASRRIAKWMLGLVPLLTMGTMAHEPIYRSLIADEEGQHRNWCVSNYSIGLRRYNFIIVVIHFLVPLLINVFSTIFIMVSLARQRMLITNQHHYHIFLRQQFNAHKHTLISPIILILLSLPRLIISLVSNCIKASNDPWLYLAAYFISFTPLVLMFIVFVLPSDLYHAEFKRHFHQKSSTAS